MRVLRNLITRLANNGLFPGNFARFRSFSADHSSFAISYFNFDRPILYPLGESTATFAGLVAGFVG